MLQSPLFFIQFITVKSRLQFQPPVFSLFPDLPGNERGDLSHITTPPADSRNLGVDNRAESRYNSHNNQTAVKPLRKSSSRSSKPQESPGWWDQGGARPGEWTFEGGLNGAIQVDADGAPPVIHRGAYDGTR